MAKYFVQMHVKYQYDYECEIEADDEEAAEDLAEQKALEAVVVSPNVVMTLAEAQGEYTGADVEVYDIHEEEE